MATCSRTALYMILLSRFPYCDQVVTHRPIAPGVRAEWAQSRVGEYTGSPSDGTTAGNPMEVRSKTSLEHHCLSTRNTTLHS
ncbi:hypothetical protein FOMPIDRAFT_1024033 [Fomitopsis schrenkii]|uniref:Uncharacterized protein n=1 Tax=Fomitopsis schrenkii TaxID=2126942 RepID=S8FEI3_FOMSC|nr:hypothetical protein FOMPIDRAFT_1024033 [Fomitopsis schrenkii]